MDTPSDRERREADPARDLFEVPPFGLASGPIFDEDEEQPPNPGRPFYEEPDFDAKFVAFLMWCLLVPVGLVMASGVLLFGYWLLAWIFPFF